MKRKPFVDRILWLINDVSKNNQKKFAEDLGILPATVNSWIKNERFPKQEQLEKIRKKLGLNINWLLTGSGPPYLYDKPSKSGDKVVQIRDTEQYYEERYKAEEDKYVEKLLKILRGDDTQNKKVIKHSLDIMADGDMELYLLDHNEWIDAGKPERRRSSR